MLDLETTIGTPVSNRVRWVGLGSFAEAYLIPVEHPKGVVIEREHKVKRMAIDHYGSDPLAYTPTTGTADRPAQALAADDRDHHPHPLRRPAGPGAAR